MIHTAAAWGGNVQLRQRGEDGKIALREPMRRPPGHAIGALVRFWRASGTRRPLEGV